MITSIPNNKESAKVCAMSSRKVKGEFGGLSTAHRRKDLSFLHCTLSQSCWKVQSETVDNSVITEGL